jgi:hypothetical protein
MPGIGSAAERRCRGFLSVFPKKSADEARETYKPARSQQAIDKKYSTHIRIRPGCAFDLETQTLELHRAFCLMQEDNKDECNRSGPKQGAAKRFSRSRRGAPRWKRKPVLREARSMIAQLNFSRINAMRRRESMRE